MTHDIGSSRTAAAAARSAWLALAIGLLSATGASAAQTVSPRPEASPVAGPADTEVAPLSRDLRVRVLRGKDIELEVRVAKGDDWTVVAERVAGGAGAADAVAAWNGGGTPQVGAWVRVPLVLLSDDFRRLVLTHLFPQDRIDGKDWVHRARDGVLPTYDEGLWQVAEWFTGDGSHFTEILKANGLSSPELRGGQAVRVPGALLHPAFRPAVLSDDGALSFDSDDDGPYAVYTIRPGEALYSAVVGRFTGRTDAEDVQELAETIRRRSGIRDLTDIPVGFPIKIPFDLLEPQFLPPNHPRRQEAEQARAELAKELEREPVGAARKGLDGVLIILDPGHGGRDLGTMNNGVWEHDYVYDVTCRLKERLERETKAVVRLTLLDKQTGCTPSRTDKLTANRQGTVLTDPEFLAREPGEARIGVNLRWYLANSIYRKAIDDGYDPDRILYLSIHADSRHPSMRGLMVYIPGREYRGGRYGSNSKTYRAFREVREQPFVSFSAKERRRSEAVSSRFADAVIAGFKAEHLPVQPHQPVRNRIIRGRWKGVPAVLRGNAIPHKVLVEMVNLSNPADAALLASAQHRSELASGLFRAIAGYFGD